MRKLIALLSAAVLATPAFAEGTVALNDAEPEAIQQATERRWAIEVEAGRAEISTQAGNGSSTYDYTGGCETHSHLCDEDPRGTIKGLAVYWEYDNRYSFGLQFQDMSNLYELNPQSSEFIDQDVTLLTLSIRRTFRHAAAVRPFVEFGLGRYTSKAEYSQGGVAQHTDTYSALTPVIGTGALIRISNGWSLVPSIRYISSVGERSGLLGITGGSHIRTLDEPVIQLSIGLRFEL